MHGQVKTDKSAAVREKEKKQKDAKLKVYRAGMAQIFERRKQGIKDWETMRCVSDVLSMNPDVYTLWNIRKEVLLHMINEKSIDEPIKVGEGELRLTETCLKINPKSYGAWHHRCWIIEHFSELDLKRELVLCNKYLKMDARNFHCWDYRRFITSKLGISAQEELSYTMEKIEEDFSNYSSWHYRSKLLPLIHSDPAGIRPIKEEIHLQELDLVQNAAFTDPNDQSAWFYLRWLLGRLEPKLEPIMSFVCKEKSKMYLVFNRDASLKDSSIEIDCQRTGKWATVNSMRDSSLWVSDLNDGSTSEYCIEVKVLNETEKICLKEDDGYMWLRKPQFDPDVSPKLKALLGEQLDSCNQLLELEPDSKWPLLTSVVFMKAINTTEYREDIIKRLRSLTEYDKYRSLYYADTLSKFLIEEEFKSNELSAESFCLKDLGLTSLYHTQYLARTERLDLSHNRLQRSLAKLVYAVNCVTLILNDNDLTSLLNIPPFPRVSSLSLAGNKLAAEEILNCIDKLPSLQKINVARNPFVQDNTAKQDFVEKLKSLRPSVEITVD